MTVSTFPRGVQAAPGAVGLIINPRSHANKARPIATGKLLARHPALRLAAPADPVALHAALADFAAAGVCLLAISGGDGTLRDVLSALPVAFAKLPDIAILPAGNTNLAARALGSSGRGTAALERLLRAHRQGRLRRRSCQVLQVSWPGLPEKAPLRGFLFGAAAFTEAKLMADAKIHRRGVQRGFAVGAAIAASAFQALRGSGRLVAPGTPVRLGVDNAPQLGGPRFLLLATTLDRLMLGLWPFWGGGAGGIRWLDIDAPPPRLGQALMAILLRRPRPWMGLNGYRSGRAERLTVHLDQPFMLDGEAFDPEPGGIVLAVAGPVTVVTP